MLTSSSTHISNNGSYSNDRGNNFEKDYGVDPASGGFFHGDFKKHDDLKDMLDSNKDSLKLEAMKRIIGMVAKGRDASMLFPAVVKNVVSKNIEVKKLVYVYLERYAEEQQDLALLSISTFQRALKEPNQLIRAGALRVLSSVRVKMISPIVMLAIKDASADMSPYVRKTAAHAIPKLYSLDNELKSELVTVIQKLLADKTVLVIGSAVMAFTEVCPERIDLIHQVYRKLCALLVDVDEWGQVTIVNMLTRYTRMQFVNPNLNINDDLNTNYESGSDGSEKSLPTLDPDHRLLLRSTRPLLQSRNAAVVMAVAQLYHHAAPKSENTLAAKALIRLLRSHVEVQSVVLNAIASISSQNKSIFEAYLKSFFVRTSDPTNIKLLKLEILTNLTTDSNVSIILRELQTYISNSDKRFVAATIQAIGRCACSINEVTDSCLNGLVSLLSNRDEAVVAESVVVIKRLLQTQAADPKEIITQMAKLLDNITVAQARAAILWLLGEHSQKVPHIAPDVLRKLTKTFPDEDEIVKLQVMNLAIKLYITNPNQTLLLCQYLFNLAKYDQNYDIRDKARLFKQFVPNQNNNIFSLKSKLIFLANKPAPLLQPSFKDREDFQLGSLSHYIKQRAVGYEPLPPFPEQAPPSDVRNVEPIANENKNNSEKKKETFPWESDSSQGDSSNYSSDSDSSSSSESSNNEGESQSEEESSEEESDEKKFNNNKSFESEYSSEESSSSTSSASEEESSNNDNVIKNVVHDNKTNKSSNNTTTKDKNNIPTKNVSNLDLLLDFSEVENTIPTLTPSLADNFVLSPTCNISANPSNIEVIKPIFTNTKSFELLDKITGKGLSATYRFTRSSHIFSPTMTNINIVFTNNTNSDITNIKIGKKNLGTGMDIHDFMCITKLPCNGNLPATLGIDFNETIQPANFEILSSLGTFSVCIKPIIGELFQPIKINEEFFIKNQMKLTGMNEHTSIIRYNSKQIINRVIETVNLGVCECGDTSFNRFAGQTLKSLTLVLVTIHDKKIIVNCENIVLGSVLLNELLRNFN